MSPAERAELHARLYLGAVFPVLASMTAAVPLRGKGRWGFGIVAGKGLEQTFAVDGGRISVVGDGSGREGDFQIDFGTAERLVWAANGDRVIPRLRRGWRHPIRVVRVLGLLRRMDRTLQGPVGQAGHPDYERLRVEWLLEVALRGVEVACRHDPQAIAILRGKAPGRARFRIGETGPGRDLVWDGAIPRLEPMSGEVGGNVEMIFRDEAVALAVLRHELDSHAAVGLGEIRISGRIPLADALGAILDRLPL